MKTFKNYFIMEVLDKANQSVVDNWVMRAVPMRTDPFITQAEHISRNIIPHGSHHVIYNLPSVNPSYNHLVPFELTDHLERNGYQVHDYNAGLAKEKTGKQRLVKIGKILTSTDRLDLLKAFNEDPNRSKKLRSPLQVLISRDPYQVAEQSTGKSWTSCMNMYGGVNANYLYQDIAHGTHVAYLIHEGDHQLKNPIARISLKPYKQQTEEEDFNTIDVSKNDHVILRPEPVSYGDDSPHFQNFVKTWAEQHFPMRQGSIYRTNDALYRDGRPTALVSPDFDFNQAAAWQKKEVLNNYYLLEQISQSDPKAHEALLQHTLNRYDPKSPKIVNFGLNTISHHLGILLDTSPNFQDTISKILDHPVSHNSDTMTGYIIQKISHKANKQTISDHVWDQLINNVANLENDKHDDALMHHLPESKIYSFVKAVAGSAKRGNSLEPTFSHVPLGRMAMIRLDDIGKYTKMTQSALDAGDIPTARHLVHGFGSSTNPSDQRMFMHFIKQYPAVDQDFNLLYNSTIPKSNREYQDYIQNNRDKIVENAPEKILSLFAPRNRNLLTPEHYIRALKNLIKQGSDQSSDNTSKRIATTSLFDYARPHLSDDQLVELFNTGKGYIPQMFSTVIKHNNVFETHPNTVQAIVNHLSTAIHTATKFAYPDEDSREMTPSDRKNIVDFYLRPSKFSQFKRPHLEDEQSHFIDRGLHGLLENGYDCIGDGNFDLINPSRNTGPLIHAIVSHYILRLPTDIDELKRRHDIVRQLVKTHTPHLEVNDVFDINKHISEATVKHMSWLPVTPDHTDLLMQQQHVNTHDFSNSLLRLSNLMSMDQVSHLIRNHPDKQLAKTLHIIGTTLYPQRKEEYIRSFAERND